MERASIGGRANWAGAAFELRLGVEFCVYILVGEAVGLGPGAVRSVQLQAPQVVDDLILEFETGARWAVQAKAGRSVRVEWNPERPFGKALRQLYQGAASGQIDLAPASLDRVELAVDHRAPATLTAFGEWLVKGRHHYRWDDFVAASTGPERDWARELPALLGAEPGDDLLAFLKKLYLRRTPAPDRYRSDLRGHLIRQGVPDAAAADRALDLLLARVAQAAPHAGWLNYDALRSACESVPGLPRPGAPPFRLFRRPSEDELYRALKMPPARPSRFVERPELTAALDTETGLLLAGRPGSGKSHALIKLALAVRLSPSTSPSTSSGHCSGQAHDTARPDWPVVVIAPHFREEDLGRLVARLRRVHTPYQLLWDDVHERPALFADAVTRLADRGDRVRVLAAYRDAHERAVRERVAPDLCRRVGIGPDALRLQPFDAGQAAQMAGAVVDALDLALDGAAREAFARHIREGDGGPLFALSVGLLLKERAAQGKPVRAADVTRLPNNLLAVWRHLYERLGERPQGFALQGLLSALHFLHRISCPLNARLVELLFTRVLEYRRGEFDSAARTLAQEGWLRREEGEFAAHDVTLEAVEESEGYFDRCVDFAREGMDGEDYALGLLRDALGRFFYRRIAFTTRKDERRHAAETSASFGAQAIEDFRVAHSPVHLAMALNNASNSYSDLAGLEETRAARVELLQRALGAVQEAARLYRELGLRADVAMALNNASGCYSDLAGQEETRAARAALLQRALGAVQEAARLYRELGLRADVAGALNNASNSYSDLAGQEEARAARVELLQRALEGVEEAVETFRSQGVVPYLMIGLANAVRRHGELAEQTGELDRARVLALCQEGETLCGPMENHDRLAFFRQVRRQLEGEP